MCLKKNKVVWFKEIYIVQTIIYIYNVIHNNREYLKINFTFFLNIIMNIFYNQFIKNINLFI